MSVIAMKGFMKAISLIHQEWRLEDLILIDSGKGYHMVGRSLMRVFDFIIRSFIKSKRPNLARVLKKLGLFIKFNKPIFDYLYEKC
jgi:hypothetical protein